MVTNIQVPVSRKEEKRLGALQDYNILDTEPEQGFDDITRLAAEICETPVAAVSVVARDRVWFKSKFGFDNAEIDRDATFCTEAIKQKDLFLVTEGNEDERFARNPHVCGIEHGFHFYAGVPLINPDGYVLGTLCVLDTVNRELSERQKSALIALAKQVEAQFELRYKVLTLEKTIEQARQYSDKILHTQERYSSVVDNLKEVVFQTDVDGRWIFLNPAWTEITGFSIEESLGEMLLNYVHPQDREINAQRFAPLIERQNEHCRYEIRYLTKDGGFRWIEVFARLTVSQKDKVVGISGTLNDITERKLAEEALKKETFYVNLLQSATAAAEEARSVGASIQICLDKICELMNWPIGHAFKVVEPDSPVLVSADIWSIKNAEEFSGFVDETRKLAYKPGKELPGRVFKSKKAVWSCQLAEELWFLRKKIVKKLGLQSGLAFPILAGTEVIAVMEFFTTKFYAPDEKFLEVMSHVGMQLGRIIERKRAEEELRASEERFRAISETSPLGIFMTDANGACVYMNETLKQISGYTADELLGWKWSKTVHADDFRRLSGDWENKGKIGEYNFVYRLLKNDGSMIWASANSAPIRVGGKIIGYVGMIEDITQRRNFEQALRESEEKYRDLFENSNDLIQSVGMDGKFVYVNPAWREKLGYTETEVENLTIWDIIHPDCNEDCREIFQKVISGEALEMAETIFSAKSGTAINVEGTINVKMKNGKPTASLAIFRDVTEKKRITAELLQAKEEAEAATKAKSEFLANMSHEIRTPMNSVIGLTGLLLEGKMSVEQRDILETVNHSAEALLTIINDILDFSKIEAGKLDLEIIDFNLRRTVCEVYDLFAEQSLKGNNKLSFNVAKEISCDLRGDPGRLRQILTNLVGNAVKFTRNGKVSITASVLQQTEKDMQIRFEVADTGIGIEPEKCQHLFKAFSQADGSITRRFGGTGLGLAICKQLIDLMNGEINIASRVEKGSVFWFIINFEKSAKAKTIAVNFKDPVERKPVFLLKKQEKEDTAKPKILVADDNAINQKVALLMLSSLGYRADVAANGLEVLDALRRQHYDLVLMDVQMPEMDGLETTRYVRREWKNLKNPHIIAMTANAMSGDRELCLEAGMNDYLSKPIRKDQLQNAIEKCETEGFKTSSESSPADAVSLNFTVLDNLAEFSPDDADGITGELISMFFEDAPQRLARLQKVYQENDCEQVKRISHALKGMCASLGAVKMADFCALIEKKAHLNSLADINRMIEQVELEFENVRNILEAEYANILDKKENRTI